MNTAPRFSDITGLVLAGGQGLRMGGADKGLRPWEGRPLVAHAVERLSPQVAEVMISANRNLTEYRALGLPVHPDICQRGFAGPLAGLLTGLTHCSTPYLLCVPCDTPRLPLNLAERLGQGMAREGVGLAIAATRAGPDGTEVRPQPVFCLVNVALRSSLAGYLASGRRQVAGWAAEYGGALVVFEDEGQFLNINTLEELTLDRGPEQGR